MLLYAGYAGSKLYNLMTPESDVDIRGVFVEPADIFFSLESMDYYKAQHADTELFSLRKFMNLALKNNPNTLDILFAPRRMWLHQSIYWRKIYQLRHEIISSRAISAIKGFVYSEYDRWLANKTSRLQDIEEYGYDRKMAAHIVRLILQANEIRSMGTYSPALFDADLQIVYKIRLGQYPRDVVTTRIENMLHPGAFKILTPKLLHEPNYDKINTLVTNIHMDIFTK